jgi:cobalt-precorrin-5B (C1)-methyltransferase
MEAFAHADAASVDLAGSVVDAAWKTAAGTLAGCDCALEIVMFDRSGGLMSRSGFRDIH